MSKKRIVATNSNFQISISLQPDGLNLLYFNLKLFDPREFIVLNISKVYDTGRKDIGIRKSEAVAKY